MITQKFTNGEIVVRIENAESIEDAKNNNFAEGTFNRFFINDKPVVNYMAMVRFIVEETQKTGKRFIPPTTAELKKLQQEVIQKQNQMMKDQLLKIKNQYKGMNAPEHILKSIEESIDKIDLTGMRVSE